MTATSLPKRGENALVIFTYGHGRSLQINQDRSGSTANWIINDRRKCAKVIIYERTERGNEIYVAKRTAVKRSRKTGRAIIELANVKYFGSTYLNWVQFTGSRNPVRYW